MSIGQIAILIDGGYFLKRVRKELPHEHTTTPEQIAKTVRRLCFNHIAKITGHRGRLWRQYLYRAFFYDAEPYTGVAHHPIANRQIEFAKSELAPNRYSLFEQLRKERKLALRLGKVNRDHDWALSPRLTKAALKTREQLAPLQGLAERLQLAKNSTAPVELQFTAAQAQQLLNAHDFWQTLQTSDISLGLRQKGVDMRIAIDIASLTLKKQVSTIVLVAGDSDFVPAAKLARREGMEFILDPLWQNVNDDLFEHIDALQSGLKRPD